MGSMKVTLPPDQQKWLETQIAAGAFASMDEALATAVADLMSIHTDDLVWAKAYVDQARQSIARGDVLAGEEYFKRLNAKIEMLRTR
jgi:Arc/MetJ-type ribon-helix-helix transcriptional regulator